MNNELKISRVEALCDGIFAIAMTFLIISFNDITHLPKTLNENEFCKMARDMLPDLGYYMQSFVVLGAFWVEHHHQFHYIRHVNLALLFINILALMFVALIPFSTLIVGDYGHTPLASILFEANLLCAGLLFYAHWVYVTRRRGMMNLAVDDDTIRFYARKNLVIPMVSILAITISVFNPRMGSSVYFMVPLAIVLQNGRRRPNGNV